MPVYRIIRERLFNPALAHPTPCLVYGWAGHGRILLQALPGNDVVLANMEAQLLAARRDGWSEAAIWEHLAQGAPGYYIWREEVAPVTAPSLQAAVLAVARQGATAGWPESAP